MVVTNSAGSVTSNAATLTAASDGAGRSVSDAGDVNGDGIGDLIVGAGLADVNGPVSGAAYAVFGEKP